MENQQIANKFEDIKLLSLLKYFLIGIPLLILPVWLFTISLSRLLGNYFFNDIKVGFNLLFPLLIIPIDIITVIWIFNQFEKNKIRFSSLIKYKISYHWYLVGFIFFINYLPFYYIADLFEKKIIPHLSYYLGFSLDFEKVNSIISTVEHNWLLCLWSIILGVIIGPILEEIFWRGIILHKYGIKYGIKKTIIISSLVFSVTHFQEHFFLTLFAFSIALSILYLITKSLLIPIFCHALLNAKAVFFKFFGIGIDDFKYFESLYDDYGNPYLLTLIFLFSIGLLVFFFYIVATRANYKSGLPYFENEQEELAKNASISCSSAEPLSG